MSEDLTKNLPSSFEERVLAEFAALNVRLTTFENRMTSLESGMASLEDRVLSVDTRLTSLEDKVDARLRETRPIWEGVQQRLTEIEKSLIIINRHFKAMVNESFDLRSRVEKLEDNQPLP
jgi:predicted nuclease with TOPRIM domain